MEIGELKELETGPRDAVEKLNNWLKAIKSARIIAGSGISLYETADGTQINAVASLDELSGFIETPTAKTYTLIARVTKPFVLNQSYFKSSAGSGTVAVKRNGSSVTGMSAISAGTGGTLSTATANHGFQIGDSFSITLSSLSSLSDLSFTFGMKCQ